MGCFSLFLSYEKMVIRISSQITHAQHNTNMIQKNGAVVCLKVVSVSSHCMVEYYNDYKIIIIKTVLHVYIRVERLLTELGG